ncbi:hypothetical protein ORV05_13790 [Amycolatopsis cynarae]|uniref:Uncharacterized protein n=1 Tax=Amycolatopsis cynarae TaxID=2995223 RepID=A0ABY7BA25_9PSEU|nr:hypothetical protein [Amycolatopsis sp. HUAS 11-8]WAL68789.1 hypothetical protein ORV05_13790 [Amycolatopsis sp. HUAS 11-8]
MPEVSDLVRSFEDRAPGGDSTLGGAVTVVGGEVDGPAVTFIHLFVGLAQTRNPGRSRMWQETLDHDGRIRQVRPHNPNGGPKVHYTFDADGNYTGKWWRDAEGNRIDA